MNPDLFRIQLRLRPLPDPVQQILAQCLMPPRLTAHLILVHHIACEIVDYLHQFSAYFDGNIVCLGAALHDLGKLEHLEELSGAGTDHEITGPDYLIKLGITKISPVLLVPMLGGPMSQKLPSKMYLLHLPIHVGKDNAILCLNKLLSSNLAHYLVVITGKSGLLSIKWSNIVAKMLKNISYGMPNFRRFLPFTSHNYSLPNKIRPTTVNRWAESAIIRGVLQVRYL